MRKDDPHPKAKRTRDPAKKLAALHDAAIQQFTDQGYENVSIASIAKSAGIAVGTVYRFYENKLSLLRAMLEDIEAEFVEQMRMDWLAGGDFPDRIDRVCVGLFAIADARMPHLKLFTMTTDVVFEDGTLPGDKIQEEIKLMYRQGMAAGAFKDANIGLMAAMAHGLVEGAMMGWMRSQNLGANDAALQLGMVMKNGLLSAEPNR